MLQLCVACALAVLVYLASHSWRDALAGFWGVIAAGMGYLYSIYGLSRAEKNQCVDPHQFLRDMYRNSIEKFVGVIFLLSLAMGVLKLSGVLVLCGFVVGQVALIVNGARFNDWRK